MGASGLEDDLCATTRMVGMVGRRPTLLDMEMIVSLQN
jgi:hypothetical protein